MDTASETYYKLEMDHDDLFGVFKFPDVERAGVDFKTTRKNERRKRPCLLTFGRLPFFCRKCRQMFGGLFIVCVYIMSNTKKQPTLRVFLTKDLRLQGGKYTVMCMETTNNIQSTSAI